MKKLILIAFMCLFSSLVLSDQIVVDKDGKPVLLKDDHTWEFVDTSQVKGKLVFTVVKAKDWFRLKKITDDFDYKYYPSVGCEYKISAENNTDYRVRIIESFVLPTDEKFGWMYPNYGNRFKCDFILEPGETRTCPYPSRVLQGLKENKLKEEPTEEETKELIVQQGCDAQRGFLTISRGSDDSSKVENIVFDTDLITPESITNYIAGNPNVPYPLPEKVD